MLNKGNMKKRIICVTFEGDKATFSKDDCLLLLECALTHPDSPIEDILRCDKMWSRICPVMDVRGPR